LGRRRRRSSVAGRLVTTVVVTVVLVAAAAFGLIDVDDLQDILLGSGEQGTVRGAGNPSEARNALRELEVAPPGSMAGYSREKFPHWSDAEEFGWDVPDTSCDARDAALIRDGRNVRVGEGCDVTSGEWRDPYTGRTYTDPSEIDIDHVVPLANAWRSGASSWSEARRERYANDPTVLLSTEDNANQEKGDKGPEAWKPPNRAIWCDYATRWVRIKASYDLSVNQREKTALEQMLDTCKGG
jgi:Protein of unknown function (DUF1524)